MKTWTFCDGSGIFIGDTYSGSEQHLAANTPFGCFAIYGRHDHLSRRVDWRPDDFGDAVPIVVPWQPPAPPDTELSTWRWDAVAERWVAEPTLAAHAAAVREERARRLAACDWVVARAVEDGHQVAEPWRRYRAALRDITAQAGFPLAVDWPDVPAG
jgi:hypothetical protein